MRRTGTSGPGRTTTTTRRSPPGTTPSSEPGDGRSRAADPRGAPSPATAPLCLGLTGGIGAGKSAALAAFRALGAATLSSDEVVHALYARPDVVAAVRARFGDDVVGEDGRIDRPLVARRAFGEEGGVRFLEELLHPLIRVERESWVAGQRARVPPPPLLVCEVPLLFEAGMAHLFDAVLVVTASPEVRRARVEARGQSFAERSGRQWDEARKVAHADRHVVNDGDIAHLKAWVADVFADYATGVP